MPRGSETTLVRREIKLLPFVTLVPGEGDEWIGATKHVQMLWSALIDCNENRIGDIDRDIDIAPPIPEIEPEVERGGGLGV